nr:GNAT family N-acetyltransferase [uncultured Cellulosilyticum sp.]
MLEFSRATVNDLSEYMRAKVDAFSDDVKQYGFGPSGYDDFEKERKNIVNYPTYKIVLDGVIIGGMTCHDLGEGLFWLGGIYIDKAHQNMGIGAKAITFIESEFPGAKRWRLHTPFKNYRNHHFYEKMGYKKIGETSPMEDKGGFYLFEYEKIIP